MSFLDKIKSAVQGLIGKGKSAGSTPGGDRFSGIGPTNLPPIDPDKEPGGGPGNPIRP